MSSRLPRGRPRNWLVPLALVMLVGQIVDRSTGQPLVGVEVAAKGPATVKAAHSSAQGRYALRGLEPGRYTLTLSSDDVPPQTFEVVVHAGGSQRFDITACSTTLDYSCAGAQP